MYAIIEAAGGQHRVEERQVLSIPSLSADSQTVVFDRVVLISDGEKQLVGKPFVEGGRVEAEVVGELQGEKVRVVKFKRRVKYRRTRGHRQNALSIRITSITPTP
jgi:large subunit ribosomal protein L21